MESIIKEKRFYDYLLTHDVDTELIIAGIDSAYGFVWNKGDNLTPEGKKQFAEIINAKYTINPNGSITIYCDNENLGQVFLASCAGHINNTTYLKWFFD